MLPDVIVLVGKIEINPSPRTIACKLTKFQDIKTYNEEPGTAKIQMQLRKKLGNEVLEYRKHNKIAYQNYMSISARDIVKCNIFCRLFVIFADFS